MEQEQHVTVPRWVKAEVLIRAQDIVKILTHMEGDIGPPEGELARTGPFGFVDAENPAPMPPAADKSESAATIYRDSTFPESRVFNLPARLPFLLQDQRPRRRHP